MDGLEKIAPDVKTYAYLKKLVRCTQRWTDLLLAHIEQSRRVNCFAPNPQRCLEFAEDLRLQLSKEKRSTGRCADSHLSPTSDLWTSNVDAFFSTTKLPDRSVCFAKLHSQRSQTLGIAKPTLEGTLNGYVFTLRKNDRRDS